MPGCESWTTAGADEMAAVFAAEAVRWRHGLEWDTAPLWPVLEHARAAGALPGLVLRDGAGSQYGSEALLNPPSVLAPMRINASIPQTM